MRGPGPDLPQQHACLVTADPYLAAAHVLDEHNNTTYACDALPLHVAVTHRLDARSRGRAVDANVLRYHELGVS